jgi:hypothetical protein
MNPESIRVWLCECGRVHVETRHCRRSFAPAEFLALARKAAGRDGTEPAFRPSKLCQQPAALRASQPLGRLLAKEAA